MIRAIASVLFGFFLATAGLAQTAPSKQINKATAVAPTPPVVRPPPPYEADLLRLVETLGSISFMASICPANGLESAEQWRVKALALIDAEAPDGPRRERLFGVFNRGFMSYSLIHRQCTDASRLVLTRLLADAAKFSRLIGSRFGG
jgi:uncharacterized protein (TIGR02301 family)